MPIPDNSSKYKRTNLFLLRVWCDDADENEHETEHETENETSDRGEWSGPTWHGRVQRTVNGEAHSFEGMDNLIEVLEAMLYKDRKDRS